MQKNKLAVSGGLTNSCKKKRSQKQRRYTHLNAEFQRKARRDKKGFLSEQYKEIQGEKIEWERVEISSRKLEIPSEHFMKRWTQ